MEQNQIKLQRRVRLAKLIQTSGISAAEFARRVERSPQQINDMLSGRKAFGEKIAREFERLADLRTGYFDSGQVPGNSDLPGGATEPESLDEALALLEGFQNSKMVTIPVMNAAASMGVGLPQPEVELIVDHLTISKDWLRANTGTSQFSNLAVLAAYGDSMTPTFSHGDLLLVDRSVDKPDIDAVLVMGYRGELFIKRLQRHPGKPLRMLSDNKNYEPIAIDDTDRDQFQVLGRVVLAWNARKM